jgi:hypothetical protein
VNQMVIEFAPLRPVVIPAETTDCGILLRHLQRQGSITTLEAYDLYNITTCGQRMTDLRKKGWPIDSEWERTPGGSNVKRYFIKKAA